MRERQLTQQQVADAAGVSRTAVIKWLRGTTPGAGELFRLSKYFQRPMEWFFEGTPGQAVSEADKSALHTAPEEMPADKLLAAARAYGLSAPRDIERLMKLSSKYRQVLTPTATGFEMHYEPLAQQSSGPKISSNPVLTDITPQSNLPSMQSEIAKVVQRLKNATAPRGKKAELARFLAVEPPRVSEWLSGDKHPSGETTLRLLHWIVQQERQQTKSPGSVSAPPGRKKQVRKSK
jgi:transcriptional regulator with XRE-family HTH domain